MTAKVRKSIVRLFSDNSKLVKKITRFERTENSDLRMRYERGLS